MIGYTYLEVSIRLYSFDQHQESKVESVAPFVMLRYCIESEQYLNIPLSMRYEVVSIRLRLEHVCLHLQN